MNQQIPNGLLFHECYLLFPKCNNLVIVDEEIFELIEKIKIRKIYEGQVQFEQQELQQLKEFDAFLQMKRYTQKLHDSQKLRLLYATKFKYEKTFTAMQQYLLWKQQELPARETPAIIKSLVLNVVIQQSGIIYLHGRDNRYRPNIFINLEKLQSGNLSQECVTYLLEYISANMLLPGQIENWNLIIDLCNFGVTQLPRQLLQNLLDYIQKYYKYRTHRIYIVNCSGTIVQNVIKNEIDQSVCKIIVEKGTQCLGLLQSCHQSQLEIRYGGTSQNLIDYWPPKQVGSTYFVETDDPKQILINKQEYQEMHQKGKLKNNKLCKDLLGDINKVLHEEAPDPEEAQFIIDDLINSNKQLYVPVTDEYQVQVQEAYRNDLYVFNAHKNKLKK